MDEVISRVDMASPSIPACKKLIWLTQTLQYAKVHVRATISSIMTCKTAQIYAIALVSFICESSSFLGEVRCDILMEDDVWIVSKTATCSNSWMAGLVEL